MPLSTQQILVGEEDFATDSNNGSSGVVSLNANQRDQETSAPSTNDSSNIDNSMSPGTRAPEVDEIGNGVDSDFWRMLQIEDVSTSCTIMPHFVLILATFGAMTLLDLH